MDILQYFNEAEAQRRAREEALRQALAPPKKKLAQEILRDMQRQEALQEKQMYHTGTLQERQMAEQGKMTRYNMGLDYKNRYLDFLKHKFNTTLQGLQSKLNVYKGKISQQAYAQANKALDTINNINATFIQNQDPSASYLLNTILDSTNKFKQGDRYDTRAFGEWVKKLKLDKNVITNPEGIVVIKPEGSLWRKAVDEYWVGKDKEGNLHYFMNKPTNEDGKRYNLIGKAEHYWAIKSTNKPFLNNVLNSIATYMASYNYAKTGGKGSYTGIHQTTPAQTTTHISGGDRRVEAKKVWDLIQNVYNTVPNKKERAVKIRQILNHYNFVSAKEVYEWANK